jgi:RHS repeat-associated protein
LTWNSIGSLQKFVWTDGNNSALNQTCTYSSDALNRIASVGCGSPWGQTFAYDAFGNVTKTANGGTSYLATYNAQTNQVKSGVTATYDANGNQTMTNFVSPISYDANQNPVMAGSTSMTYDALGRLVEFGGKPVVYGPSGEKLAVFNGTAYTASIALPGGGEAYYTSGALTSLRHKDWLGSSRLATSWAHAVVSKAAYAPYGENYNLSGTTDLDFTGQTQASVSTLFDFPARKYDPNAGRWTVPDPGGWSVVDPTNPQSFNRYAYVLNQPLAFIDPTGLDPCGTSYDGPEMDPGYCPAQQIGSQIIFQSGNNPPPPPPVDNSQAVLMSLFFLSQESLQMATFQFFGSTGIGQYLQQQLRGAAGTSGPTAPSNSPCNQAGGAPNPSFYAGKGSNVRALSLVSPTAALALNTDYLTQFRRGGSLDAQPLGGSRAYGNYVYGAYNAAAGFLTLPQTLSGANAYANVSKAQYPGQNMDKQYPFIPADNVTNISLGYNAFQSGTMCHK